ncbi:hypothetical protein DPMN_175649 [Dreissena polymorpha]|uniref:Uncharacterized protein n=1 Tax=Dreissena polymorpha TaxID=45954 RepID=A0A9D4IJU3_DREPO|nr:hypothetical protein DPMN_175649 [Dreissena polymorpha]
MSIGDAECRDVVGVCFLSSQTVFLDKCWMLTATGEDLLHTYYMPDTSNHFDILGLNPETEFTLRLNIQTPGTPVQQTDFLTTQTGKLLQ